MKDKYLHELITKYCELYAAFIQSGCTYEEAHKNVEQFIRAGFGLHPTREDNK